MRRGIRRNFEIRRRIRGRRRIPIERIERRENVRWRVGEPIVHIHSGRNGKRVSFSGRVGADGRYGRPAGKIQTVTAGAVGTVETLRTPRSGYWIGFSESVGAESLPVYEVDGSEIAVVVYGPEPADHIGKRGRVPIRSQSRARVGSGENHRNPFPVHVNAGAVSGSGMVGVPGYDDMVKR